jgi:N-methylhydantoinase B
MDAIQLEIFKHLFNAVAEEMGVALRKSSYSPNIKERRDFSCAVFDPQGELIAQAAHIPVHLGSMPLSVQAAIESFPQMSPGDMVLLNDPFRGGTHLPDLTLVCPVFSQGELLGFVANRAHHADIGGITPGSMPVAREIYQEGLVIPPVLLVRQGEFDQGIVDLILANVRTPGERQGDIWAQFAANYRGHNRLQEIAIQRGNSTLLEAMQALNDYTERLSRQLIASLPDGNYQFEDVLDDDGVTEDPVRICVKLSIQGDSAIVDFSGSDQQRAGSINAVFSITLSAVYYVFRCLFDQEVPSNAGLLRPITVLAQPGSVVNASHPAPVAGGNVETSQRIVDVLLGAFAQILPERIPAASQGTMNNVSLGGQDLQNLPFTYYETIAGGMGARPGLDGLDAVHTHMTNTLNTPIEALEFSYPLRVTKYAIRTGSGGKGKYRGGDGLQREIEARVPLTVTILSERRRFRPYGLAGGKPGEQGINFIRRFLGKEELLPGKGTFDLETGDILCIHTPGGGGFGM